MLTVWTSYHSFRRRGRLSRILGRDIHYLVQAEVPELLKIEDVCESIHIEQSVIVVVPNKDAAECFIINLSIRDEDFNLSISELEHSFEALMSADNFEIGGAFDAAVIAILLD